MDLKVVKPDVRQKEDTEAGSKHVLSDERDAAVVAVHKPQHDRRESEAER